MKKSFLFSVTLTSILAVAGRQAHAQVPYAEYGLGGTAGRASIGAAYRLDPLYITSYIGMNISPDGSGAWGLGYDSANNGGGMILGGVSGEMQFVTVPTSNPTQARSLSDADIKRNIRMTINRSGQIQIGIPTPQTQTDYKLSVSGKIVSQSLYITNPSNWADFVFAPAYKPMSLLKLEAYLQQNKHLPAIPSASEVEAKGYSVTEMDAKLLQTIEELTLHVIELSKQVKELQAAKGVTSRK